MILVMPNAMAPAEIYVALIRKLKERSAIVADAVRSAQGYRFENGILYLRYPEPLINSPPKS